MDVTPFLYNEFRIKSSKAHFYEILEGLIKPQENLVGDSSHYFSGQIKEVEFWAEKNYDFNSMAVQQPFSPFNFFFTQVLGRVEAEESSLIVSTWTKIKPFYSNALIISIIMFAVLFLFFGEFSIYSIPLILLLTVILIALFSLSYLWIDSKKFQEIITKQFDNHSVTTRLSKK
jgi:ABC-type bacteriocin/lantibiotic exporter with double-glycine peptidase domain